MKLNHEYIIYFTKEGYRSYKYTVNTTVPSEYLDEDGNSGSTIDMYFTKLEDSTDGTQIEDLGIEDFRELGREME